MTARTTAKWSVMLAGTKLNERLRWQLLARQKTKTRHPGPRNYSNCFASSYSCCRAAGGGGVHAKAVAEDSSATTSTALSTAHTPVLLSPVLESFAKTNLRVVVDGTVGAGSHAKQILEAHPEIDLYLGLDADPFALSVAKERLQKFDDKVELKHLNFRDYKSLLSEFSSLRGGVDGILLDLGVSSMQLDNGGRGFSFMRGGPLDMRMNPEAPLSAWNVVNHYSEQDLGRIFRDFGEERHWKKFARVIVQERVVQPIDTTLQLADLISRHTRVAKKRRGGSRGGAGKKSIHPATKIFQAVRIEVNGELDAIDAALPPMIESLRAGGRIGVISFHSLEDRRVKHTFLEYSGERKGSVEKLTKMERYSGIAPEASEEKTAVLRMLKRKPTTASIEEMELNPRSRSAKYRWAEKL